MQDFYHLVGNSHSFYIVLPTLLGLGVREIFRFPGGETDFLFSRVSTQALVPIQPRIQFKLLAPSPWMCVGCEADHSAPSVADAKNEWSYTPTSARAFMVTSWLTYFLSSYPLHLNTFHYFFYPLPPTNRRPSSSRISPSPRFVQPTHQCCTPTRPPPQRGTVSVCVYFRIHLRSKIHQSVCRQAILLRIGSDSWLASSP